MPARPMSFPCNRGPHLSSTDNNEIKFLVLDDPHAYQFAYRDIDSIQKVPTPRPLVRSLKRIISGTARDGTSGLVCGLPAEMAKANNDTLEMIE